MQRTGVVDRTVDTEFDEEYERFKVYAFVTTYIN